MKIIPLVVDSLGAIPKQFGNRLKQTGITAEIGQVQKTVLLGTAGILRKVSKSKPAGCGLILREFSSIVLLCVSSIIMIIIKVTMKIIPIRVIMIRLLVR